LISRSGAVAAALLEGSDDLNESRVAYLIPAGVDYIITQWGIWRAGGIAVPLSSSATEKELEYTLADSQADIIVTIHELSPKVSSLCDRHDLRLVFVDDIDSLSQANLPEINPDRRAMILYTSGTTSKPKGVVTTHACIQAQIESLVGAWHWQSNDRIPLFLPLHHIHGIINIMSCALWSGAEIEPFSRFDLDAILPRVADGAYSVFMAVPTIYVKLIEALESMADAERAPAIDGFGKMRLMISGSAALPASVHEKWTELTGQKLLERYGMTEVGMALSNPYEGQRRPGAVGQPLPGVEVRLHSDQGRVISEEDVSGEIQVRGPNVFLEYWNRPDATQESFLDGWFRTGDIAVLEDGYYRIMGRSSIDIIKSGGYKLSALEIEAALLDHSSITQCAVVGVPDETWGEAVAAAVVVVDGDGLELESLRSWCRDRISPYKIPRRLLVVDKLPRNAMGKVTKPAVLKLFE
jgi:malonyl-CoA/methylmalonyl-CoA synthetase